jgi:hypothetical protein
MKLLLLPAIVAISLFSEVVSAQTAPVTERPAALNRLNFLEGRWRMKGWGPGEKGRENVEFLARCEWMSRFMMCREEAPKTGEWPGFEVYSYNDRKSRYEGLFADPLGQIAAHPVRWEGEKMISEYEYHVGGAYHLVRRTMVANGEGAYQWTVEDLADDKVSVVIELTATRLGK